MELVAAAAITAIPAMVAAVAAWRAHREVRTGNGHSAGQSLNLILEKQDRIEERQLRHDLLDEYRFAEVKARLDRIDQ